VAEARAHVEAGDYHAWASATAAAMREGDELGTPNGVPENPRRKRQSEE